jgi:hypothetical protein
VVVQDSIGIDETRDRSVRWVLWTSLAIGLAPIAAALALVLPVLGQHSLSGAASHLEAELALGRSGAGDQLRAVLSRSASGIARVVTGARADLEGDWSGSGAAPSTDSLMSRLERSIFAGAGRGCIGLRGAIGASCEEPPATAEPKPEAPLRFAELGGPFPARTVDGGGVLGQPRREPASTDALREIAWRAREEGVYVRDLGGASLELAGAVAVDDFGSLRPIEAVGVGAYLSGAPELHHSTLSGRAAGSFAQGRWRLRPELDIGASYLALEKVRLDAGEAGLFLPDADDWIFSARPSLAFEGELDAMPGVKVLPSLRAGATWLSQDEYSSAAMMLDMPASIAGIAANLPVEETFADVEAGLGIAASERILLSVSYGRLFGEAFESQTGRLELNMQF